jgi:branched-chain amino acid transport system substrate-binding protein
MRKSILRRGIPLTALALLAALAIAVGALAKTNSSGPAKAGSAASPDKSLIKCGNRRGIGLLAPYTGPAASIGTLQVSWMRFFVAAYNKTHKVKYFIQGQDTMLGAANGTAEALKGAQALASNPRVLGTVGPAGSNEVQATTAALKAGGLAFVTGSATRTSLALDGTRTGYFYRVVPPDSAQGLNVASFILKTLKLQKVYIIDDQEAYSTGLADTVQALLQKGGVSVTRDGVSQQQSDFSSLIAKIPRDTQLVYLPWQLPPKGQAFGQQMKAAGKGDVKLMGSDGLFDPAFSGVGGNVYDSFFPLQPANAVVKAYEAAHNGNADLFGAPSYVAAQVLVGAIDRACADGTATRAEVRAQMLKTNVAASKNLLGLTVTFARNGNLVHGAFGIYQSKNGQFARIG